MTIWPQFRVGDDHTQREVCSTRDGFLYDELSIRNVLILQLKVQFLTLDINKLNKDSQPQKTANISF